MRRRRRRRRTWLTVTNDSGEWTDLTDCYDCSPEARSSAAAEWRGACGLCVACEGAESTMAFGPFPFCFCSPGFLDAGSLALALFLLLPCKYPYTRCYFFFPLLLGACSSSGSLAWYVSFDLGTVGVLASASASAVGGMQLKLECLLERSLPLPLPLSLPLPLLLSAFCFLLTLSLSAIAFSFCSRFLFSASASASASARAQSTSFSNLPRCHGSRQAIRNAVDEWGKAGQRVGVGDWRVFECGV